MVVLGSGGHTTEMIHLLEQLDTDTYSPFVYIVANSDNTSIARLKQYIGEVQSSNETTKTNRWKGRYPLENESKLVYPVVDQFVVHWPSLKQKYSLETASRLK
eukprot:scaffold184382_cov85-Cyclotella_meneghiniana.AAC.5